MYRLALDMASPNPYFSDIALASVRAIRKKSESPNVSLAAAIFAACSSAGITFKIWGKQLKANVMG